MYQLATAGDIEGMKKLVDKSQSKAIKSCLKSNTHRDEATNPFPRRVEFRRIRTEREYQYDYQDKSRKWYNVSRNMAFVDYDIQRLRRVHCRLT